MLTRAHLDSLRRYEIDRVLALVPDQRGALLEIGAAGGFQAALLAQHFDQVAAIDLPPSIPAGATAFPVQPYDGKRLPFPNSSFDVVFSSNVLEHIPHVEAFQAEIRRVLKPGGRAVHVLPSASWRLWTTLTHYLDLPTRVLARFGSRPEPAGEAPVAAPISPRPGLGARLGNLLFEYRHGERGTTLGELYLFSRPAWRALFRRNGFVVERAVPLGLFYTGYSLCDSYLDVRTRRSLAAVLGSATVLYVLRDKDSA
jgi:SAM-dependent methyltransferase